MFKALSYSKSYWLLLALFPAITIGLKSIYFFDFFIFGFYCYAAFIANIKFKNVDIIFVFVLVLLVLLIFITQVIIGGSIHSASILRFILFFFIIFYFNCFDDYYFFQKFAAKFLVFVSLIGIVQFIDGYMLNNLFNVNGVVSTLYPYNGVISESDLAKTAGAHIKSGSFYRATSIADGHPILLGDMLAVLSLFLLFWRKYISFIIVAIAVVLTFSRASWLILALGFTAYFIFEFRRLKPKFYFLMLTAGAVALIAIFSYSSLYDAFYFRVVNTLSTFGLSDVSIGRSDDPRIAHVWPNFIKSMLDTGWTSFIAGSNVRVPTDSGYLAVLRESGFIGIFIYILIFYYILIFSKYDRLVCVLFIAVACGMIFHPLQQGYRFIFIFFVFMAYHIRYVRQKENSI